MGFTKSEWIGSWENFECYFDSSAAEIVRAWEIAEETVKNPPMSMMFKNGAKAFWQTACATATEENPITLGGWDIADSGDSITISWLDREGKQLFKDEYVIIETVEKGLEGAECFLFEAKTSDNTPFKYLLSMSPMPERTAKNNGGHLSHLHFQYSSKKENILNGDKLVKPYWYATMCDKDGTIIDKQNIIFALHRVSG